MENLFKGREKGSAIDIKIGKKTYLASASEDKKERNRKKCE
jgi:hypothetical protein